MLFFEPQVFLLPPRLLSLFHRAGFLEMLCMGSHELTLAVILKGRMFSHPYIPGEP